ncbi:MAG: NERD domain-containing protein, partial [Clostridia bacterium]|nr:NERD domain-containing protein [Clostridia bacterium]
MSEKDVTLKLTTKIIMSSGGKTLNNLFVPRNNGISSEIDIVHITKKGIFVFENKNYAGYIFGDEMNKEWTVTTYTGKNHFGRKTIAKYHFYNPIRQNKSHIKSLLEYLHMDVRTFSFITFSDRGELKNVTTHSPDVFVCNHRDLSNYMSMLWDCNPYVLTEDQINY